MHCELVNVVPKINHWKHLNAWKIIPKKHTLKMKSSKLNFRPNWNNSMVLKLILVCGSKSDRLAAYVEPWNYNAVEGVDFNLTVLI